MATVTWRGGVEAVAQVSDGSITAFDAATTYTITIGGYDVSVPGNTSTTQTATDLVAAANGSTHPYFAAITWSVPSGSTVRGTGDVAGAPFAATLAATGGTGTVTNFSDTTACTGPHHADALDNWSGGALPAASDTVIFDGGPSVLYGLDGFSATALARVEVRQAFLSLIGLETSQFATSLDGLTLDSSVREYRGAYLELTADEIVVGEHIGPGSPSGSQRLALEQKKAGASLLDVVNTSSTTLNDRPCVRYKAANASADVLVRAAPGGVGVAIESGETSTIGDFAVADDSATSAFHIGGGTTASNVFLDGGIGQAAFAANVTLVEVRGGELDIVGYDYTVTTLTVFGGTVTDTHEHTSAADWTTINMHGGTLSLPRAGASRSYTTMNLYGGRVEADWSVLTGAEDMATAATVADRRAIEVSTL